LSAADSAEAVPEAPAVDAADALGSIDVINDSGSLNTTDTFGAVDTTGAMGAIDLGPTEASATDAAPAEEASNEPESEMSRRMNEILGSFDDGIATEKAISSGKGKIVQGTAVRADAPKPDFVQEQAALNQNVASIVSEGSYDTNATVAPEATVDGATAEQSGDAALGVDAEADVAATPEAGVVDQFPETTVVMDTPMYSDTPLANPSLTGVPRSNIEQAAAEQAARDAVAAAESKKIDPKILVGIVIAIIVILASSVVTVIGLTSKKSSPSGTGASQVEPEEPEPESEPTQRIGTLEFGYVDVPDDWNRLITDQYVDQFAYADGEGENIVILNAFAVDENMTAKGFASTQLVGADEAGMSQPQLKEMKVGERDCFQVFYYNQSAEQWTFEFIF
jgi:hypothetical protein